MLKLKNKKGKISFSGECSFEKSFPDEEYGKIDVEICAIHYLSEKGCYFDWGMERCGFGQFSMSLRDNGKWEIMNECMGLNSCLMFVETLKEGIAKLNNSKIDYVIKKLIKNMNKECESLEQGLAMIWQSAEKDERDEFISGEPFENNVVIDETIIKSFSFEQKERKGKGVSYFQVDLMMNLDILWQQFGNFYIGKVISSDGLMNYHVSKNMKYDTLVKVINCLESLDRFNFRNEDKEVLSKMKKGWADFKKACNLEGTVEDIADIIFDKKNLIEIESRNFRLRG